jgi:putative membrane protein
VTRLVPILDPSRSIASTRRVLSLFFISTVIWILPASIGAVADFVSHSQTGAGEFVLGAFLVWAFELVVINGAFLRSTLKSLSLAAIHPLLIVLTVTGYNHTYLYPVVFGLLVLGSAVVFLSRLKHLRTENGIESVTLLQAFLKTWVEHEPSELEGCFLKYAKTQSVQTEVFVSKTGTRELSMVIPGVHPGPFSPVGSYNLSELIYRGLRSDRTFPIILHGTGGHERNAPTNLLTSEYAGLIQRFVSSLEVTEGGRMKGPLRSKVGITYITTMSFGKEVIAMLSSAPFVSEDLDPASITDATEAASELGLELSIVDAHNSIGTESQDQTTITKDDWRRILNDTLALPENPLSIGFAHSTEIEFKHGVDVSEGGIGVVIFSAGDSQSILITADSNNAVSGLRQKIADTVEKMGFKFIELCTSDTHAFAARSLTHRGYFALGEGTPIDDIIGAIDALARKAQVSVAPCATRVGSFKTELPLVGRESLDDFAALTSRAVSLAKTYAEVVIPSVLLFVVITLFY